MSKGGADTHISKGDTQTVLSTGNDHNSHISSSKFNLNLKFQPIKNFEKLRP
jgi:hypothetical protein